MFSRRDQIAVYGFPRRGGGALVPTRGKDIYVWAADRSGRYRGGSDEATGSDWDSALRTMREALARAKSCDRIFFTGDVREEISIASSELSDLNLKFDITIQGCGGLHHPDQPGSGTDLYDVASASWRPPASPTAATPLLQVYARGWRFYDIMFDTPVDAAAIKLTNNSGSGTTEYDASHGVVDGCVFQQGKYGIQVDGPIGNYQVRNSDFAILSVAGGCGIFAATDGGPNYRWKILNNFFVPAATVEGNKGNQSHIDLALFSSLIKGNDVGTVESTGKYIDLTGGQDNIVTANYLMGTYDTSDYVAATGDGWVGNFSADVGQDEVDADGTTIAVPAAP